MNGIFIRSSWPLVAGAQPPARHFVAISTPVASVPMVLPFAPRS